MPNFLRQEIIDFLRLVKADRVTIIVGTALLSLILFFALTTLAGQSSDFARTIASRIDISTDGSLSETINHGVALFAAVMFLLTFFERRSSNFLSLAALMLFVCLDDAARYHERLGNHLVETFELIAAPGLRPQDTGEFLAWVLAGIVFSGVFWWSINKRQPRDLGILATVLAPFLLLVFFGVVVDFLHVLAPPNLNVLVGTVEDGGEMLSVALIATLAIGIQRNSSAYYEVPLGPRPIDD